MRHLREVVGHLVGHVFPLSAARYIKLEDLLPRRQPARLGPENAKAILDIMVRDALDETGKNLLRLILGRAFHGRRD